MSDIVERLRHCPTDWHPAVVADQAADEIARLRAEIGKLREALRDVATVRGLASDLQARARAALAGAEKEGE